MNTGFKPDRTAWTVDLAVSNGDIPADKKPGFDQIVAKMLAENEGTSDLLFVVGRPPQVEEHGKLKGVQVDLALSQIVTQCQLQIRNMPPGTFPPQILKYDAASVPKWPAARQSFDKLDIVGGRIWWALRSQGRAFSYS